MNNDPYWLIEYEIPPMRAIWTESLSVTEFTQDEESVRSLLGSSEPRCRIRSVTKVTPVEQLEAQKRIQEVKP